MIVCCYRLLLYIYISKKFQTGPFEQTPHDLKLKMGPRARALKGFKFDYFKARARADPGVCSKGPVQNFSEYMKIYSLRIHLYIHIDLEP